MMDSPVRVLRALRTPAKVVVALFVATSVRCSSSAEQGDSAPGDGDGTLGIDRERTEIPYGFAMGGASGESVPLHPLCGPGLCVPDKKSSCPSMGEGGAGGAGAGELGGAAGGVAYDPGDLGVQGLSCRVQPELDCDEGEACAVERACGPYGASEVGEPCVSQADCSAGLACVGDAGGGICRPYCCEGTARSCGVGTFCDERSFPEAPEIFVPVCLPVDKCPLTDPFPCPDGQECACQEDRACVVVRADGATSCTIPGQGRLGDPCSGTTTAECAHGFVCHPEVGCMQLCSTVSSEGTAGDDEEAECPNGGTCLSPPQFPSDLGICVGDDSGVVAAR